MMLLVYHRLYITSMFYAPAVGGRHFQEVLLLQVQYMTDIFQEWRKADGILFKRIWIDGLLLYDKKTGIDWKWLAIDGVITKGPLGGKIYGPKSHGQI
jgi:hypothetical protein